MRAVSRLVRSFLKGVSTATPQKAIRSVRGRGARGHDDPEAAAAIPALLSERIRDPALWFGEDARRGLLRGLQSFLAWLHTRSAHPSLENLRKWAAISQEARRRSIDRLLCQPGFEECLIRIVDWGLADELGRFPGPVRFVSADAGPSAEAVAPTGVPELVWWLSDDVPPARLLGEAACGNRLIVTDEPAMADRVLLNVVVDCAPLRIARPSRDSPQMCLPGSGGAIQGLTRDTGSPGRQAWRPIEPPQGFTGLSQDPTVEEIWHMLERNRICCARIAGNSDQLAFPSGCAPKNVAWRRWLERTQKHDSVRRTGRMKKEQRGMATVQLEMGDIAPDPVALGTLTVAVPLTNNTKPRPADRLRKELAEIQANSVEELCEKLDLRIEGPIKDADGKEHRVSIPIQNKSTFEEDGLTRSDPTLLRMYVDWRTADALARWLADRDQERLTDEQIAHLKDSVSQIESSLEENQ